MRIPVVMALLLGTAIVAGCHRAPKEVPLGQVLPNIPLPPDPEPLLRQNGTDAIQFVVTSRDKPDSVVSYYRSVLSRDPYRLINERKGGNTTAFYAEEDGPSIWVTVTPNGDGSQVTIAGASEPKAATSAKP